MELIAAPLICAHALQQGWKTTAQADGSSQL